MKVTLIGKSYASGKSKKTGKDFAATIAHVSYKKNGVEGAAVESVWLDPSTYPVDSLKIGAAYNLDRDGGGYVVAFDVA